jgi:hypothetical protein
MGEHFGIGEGDGFAYDFIGGFDLLAEAIAEASLDEAD